MRMPRLSTCGVFWLITLIILSHSPARAEVSLTVTGISAISNNSIAQAEKSAYDDAIHKAYLELALRNAPASSAVDLAQKLSGFVASRGNQDIVQYQIVSRSQQDSILYLNLDLRMNDAPLRDWLQAQAFTTPLRMRPLILLAVSTKGPGAAERYEWWSSTSPKGYSPFENQLAFRLRTAGENIAEVPKRITVLPASPDKPVAMASGLGTDLVVTGAVTHRTVDAATIESRVDISLLDVKTRQKMFAFTLSLKGTADVRTMNELIITAFLDQLRSEISKKVVVVSPVLRDKSLCIEGIRDYGTYQSMINSLRSMDAVTKIAISSIHGHSICHAITIKGNLTDIMDNFRQKMVAKADVIIDDDRASVRLFNP